MNANDQSRERQILDRVKTFIHTFGIDKLRRPTRIQIIKASNPTYDRYLDFGGFTIYEDLKYVHDHNTLKNLYDNDHEISNILHLVKDEIYKSTNSPEISEAITLSIVKHVLDGFDDDWIVRSIYNNINSQNILVTNTCWIDGVYLEDKSYVLLDNIKIRRPTLEVIRKMVTVSGRGRLAR